MKPDIAKAPRQHLCFFDEGAGRGDLLVVFPTDRRAVRRDRKPFGLTERAQNGDGFVEILTGFRNVAIAADALAGLRERLSQAASARWASTAALSAAPAPSNAAQNASPTVLNTSPPWRVIACLSSPSCRASDARIASG